MNNKELKQKANELKKELNIKKEDTIYYFIDHVAPSGMSRTIKFYYFKDNQPYNLDHIISELLGYKLSKKYSGVDISGCGMNMATDTIMKLSNLLFNDDLNVYSHQYNYCLHDRQL